MAIAKKCDRCGKYYEPYNFACDSEKINGVKTLNIDDNGKYFAQDTLDFCPECCEEFNIWLNRKGSIVTCDFGISKHDENIGNGYMPDIMGWDKQEIALKPLG